MVVLFLCTGNSCRSILAEAIFNHIAPAGWTAMSAGSHPTGVVHPRSCVTRTRTNPDLEAKEQVLGQPASDARDRHHCVFQRSP